MLMVHLQRNETIIAGTCNVWEWGSRDSLNAHLSFRRTSVVNVPGTNEFTRAHNTLGNWRNPFLLLNFISENVSIETLNFYHIDLYTI